MAEYRIEDYDELTKAGGTVPASKGGDKQAPKKAAAKVVESTSQTAPKKAAGESVSTTKTAQTKG